MIKADKRAQFTTLFAEFLHSYPDTVAGKKHVGWYDVARAEARKGYEAILAAEAKKDDVTELVLRRLLPHQDTPFNRDRGAWTTFAPAVTKEIKSWFENSPHIKTNPGDWPIIAKALLRFVRQCVQDPSSLKVACKEFTALPLTKGFQTGMLSPILNALEPDHFFLINNKSRGVLNYFAETSFTQQLSNYPECMSTGFVLVADLKNELSASDLPLRDDDKFDIFSHWLVAVKNFPLEKIDYWKVSPGDKGWQWDESREQGFIGIGWEELGDVSKMSKGDFEERCKLLLAEHPDWKKNRLEQVWKLSRMREGDRIVANNGTSEVLGIGTVSGAYFFKDGVKHGHRLPVEWNDIGRRRVSKPGWRRTVISLDRPEFEEILAVPTIEESSEPVRGPSIAPPGPVVQPDYSIEQLAADTHHDLVDVERWVRAIERKKHAILAGPPGTGKTFCAKRLARHLVSDGDGFSDVVQFHPSYGYEDFIQGIRPKATEDGALIYPMVPGRFMEFCDAASKRKGSCVLLIDEINRANLSRVFGELMYLLEYRNEDIPLAGGARLRIPENVRILGTMNTADRSIALIDHALRRRFAFLPLPPSFDALRRFHEQKETEFHTAGLIKVLQRLNNEIGDSHYHVGVSFFLDEDLEDLIADVWQMEIEPYVEEYFFDQPAKVAAFRWSKVSGEISA